MSVNVASWISRVVVAVVFVINVWCALGFIIDPSGYMGAYELSGVSGKVAIQGIGVAFLMWNATYPLVIANPMKHRTLFAIVLVQQLIGVAGESIILASLEPGHALLSASILRFIAFDAGGLVLMSISFALLVVAMRKASRLEP
ncbi:MAG: hypothetical protein IKE61_01440 [Coriobacteriales bacterium]|nr:hypothetical protein [Coriobacteriales bacterium]